MMRFHSRRHARRILTCAGALTACLAATRVNAQAAITQSPSMRLGDLYAEVARSNPKIAAARALAAAVEARVAGARRPPDPQLQLGFMNYALPGLEAMAPLSMTQLQLMQMVPLGGKLTLAGRVAGARAQASAERARDLEWELRAQSAMAFYDLYATDRQLEVARGTIRLLQDIARTAESMYRVGEGRQADVLRAQVEIARMTADTLRMAAMRGTMLARLNALRNRAADDLPLDVRRPEFPDVLPDRALVDSLAMAGRPMLRAGASDVRASDAAAALARAEIIPDLQVGVQYGQRAEERMGSLMIGASIPIFARDRQRQMRKEMDAMKAMTIADLEAMQADTRGKVGEVFASLTRARDLARLYRTAVLPQAEAAVSSAFASYRVGRLDVMTVLDGQMAVNRYREELVTLEADEGKAWAELEMLTGRELLDSNSIAGALGVAAKEGVR